MVISLTYTWHLAEDKISVVLEVMCEQKMDEFMMNNNISECQ